MDRLNERTSGNIGLLVFKGLLFLAADHLGIRICGFRLPYGFIDKFVSDRSWPLLGARCFRIIHHHPTFPKSICFFSSQAPSWYELFERQGIETEDRFGIKSYRSVLDAPLKGVPLVIGVVLASAFLAFVISAFVVNAIW
jgi:hypothetical protein